MSVRLAAQCTDARVNVVTEELFAKYPSVAALAAATPEEIEEIVRPCGLGAQQGAGHQPCDAMLMRDFGGKVPDDFDTLLTLPGVGRKRANLIMGDVFGKPAIVTDTHCNRLCNRMGIVKDLKEPKKVEMALWKVIPPQEGNDFCHRQVLHGRAVCTRPPPRNARSAASRNCARATAMHKRRLQEETPRPKRKLPRRQMPSRRS